MKGIEMFVRIEEVLSEVRQYPDGVTIAYLVDSHGIDGKKRQAIVKKYCDRLQRLYRLGFVTRQGEGRRTSQFIWRPIE